MLLSNLLRNVFVSLLIKIHSSHSKRLQIRETKIQNASVLWGIIMSARENDIQSKLKVHKSKKSVPMTGDESKGGTAYQDSNLT